MKQSDKGILLNKIAYSETSLIVNFLTEGNGIQTFLFQGGKKKAAYLYPLAICEIEYYGRPDSELKKLSKSDIIHICPHIPMDPLKSSVAFFIAELLAKTIKTNQGDSALFNFLVARILHLDNAIHVSNIPLQFLIDFSSFLGIQPQLIGSRPSYFNLEEGEISSSNASNGASYSGLAVQHIAKLLSGLDHEESTKLIRKDAFNLLMQYYEMHIPGCKNLKTLEIIDEIFYT